MRLAGLYARSRLAGYAIAVLALVALASWAAALGLVSRPFAVPEVVLVPVLVFAPLAAACVVVAGAASPFGETEHVVGYPVLALRLGHLAGLLACAALALLAALALGPNHGGWMLARNLLGFAGLALLAARAVGGWMSWTVPFAFVTVAAFMGRAGQDPERARPLAELMGLAPAGEYEWWAWPLRPGEDPHSWVVVLGLALVGLSLVCLFGARDLSGEEQ